MKDNFNHRRYVSCDISYRLQGRKGSGAQKSGGAKAGKREREEEREMYARGTRTVERREQIEI